MWCVAPSIGGTRQHTASHSGILLEILNADRFCTASKSAAIDRISSALTMRASRCTLSLPRCNGATNEDSRAVAGVSRTKQSRLTGRYSPAGAIGEGSNRAQ